MDKERKERRQARRKERKEGRKEGKMEGRKEGRKEGRILSMRRGSRVVVECVEQGFVSQGMARDR